ncbi:MAG: sterol desaturase family protein [Erythrobacter sp.]
MLGLATVIVRVVAFAFPLIGGVAAAAFAADRGWGLFNLIDLPRWAEFVLAFIILDLVIWAQHLATHRIPVLWRLHRVHHSDRDIDVSSALRFHPLEILFSAAVKLIAILALGPSVIAVVVFEIALNGCAMFNHSNWALPKRFDAFLRIFIVTPDMHRVHHSILRSEHDRNFGFCLSIWDRMFGVYKAQPSAGHDGMTIGLDAWQDDRPAKLGWSLGFPFSKV